MNATINIKPSVILMLIIALVAWIICDNKRRTAKRSSTPVNAAPKPKTNWQDASKSNKPISEPVIHKANGEHRPGNPFPGKYAASPIKSEEEVRAESMAHAINVMRSAQQEGKADQWQQ